MLENLIEFLERKALLTINSFKDYEINTNRLIFNRSAPEKLEVIISNEVRCLRKKQSYFNKILELLIKISDIRKNNLETSDIEHEINKIFKVYINDIMVQKEIYDKNHPFFGYPKFEKKMLEECIKTENFEMCTRLVSINHNE